MDHMRISGNEDIESNLVISIAGTKGYILHLWNGVHLIFTMISYFCRWTLLKKLIQFMMNRVNKKFGGLAESHAKWLIHQMMLSARYCGNFEFITFLGQF